MENQCFRIFLCYGELYCATARCYSFGPPDSISLFACFGACRKGEATQPSEVVREISAFAAPKRKTQILIIILIPESI